jgi:hypothetical protein
MSLIGNILYFAGYTFDFENNIHVPPLDIEVGRHNTYVARPRAKKKEHLRQKIISYLYTCFIVLVIIWLVPYSLYMAIRDKSIIPFGRSWFQVIIVQQYYYAILYFSKNHFYENIVCNTSLMRYIKITVPLTTVISLLLAIFNVCALNQGFRIHGYDEIYNYSNDVGKVFISILIFADSIYSYLTFSINACVFAVNMLYHKETVSNYSRNLNNYITNSLNMVRKLNNVATEFSQMKNKFVKTVELLTPFFASLNFIGFLTMYFYMVAIANGTIGVMERINIAMFVTVLIIYIISIQTVNANISNISDTISSNSLITTFFGNKQFNRVIPSIEKNTEMQNLNVNANTYLDDQKDDNLNIKRHDTDEQPDNGALDPGIMDHGIMANQEFISDQEFVTEIIPEFTPEFHRITTQKESSGTEIHNNGTLNAGLTNTYNIMKQNMIASISTEQMMDWLILQGIVGGRWKSFRIFGVEFTDSSLISKLFGVAVTVLVSAQFGMMVKWW